MRHPITRLAWQPAITLLFGVCLAAQVRADIVSYARIDSVVSQADLIVVGTVTKCVADKQGKGQITLLPSEWIKGNATKGAITVAFENNSLNFMRPLEGKRALVFAAKSGPEEYRLVPVVHGKTAVNHQIFVPDFEVRSPLLAPDANDTPLVKVIKEIGTIAAHSRTNEPRLFLHNLGWAGVEVETVRKVLIAINRSKSP